MTEETQAGLLFLVTVTEMCAIFFANLAESDTFQVIFLAG